MMLNALADGAESLRPLQPRWNEALIAASIAISFLGAFTSSQLMCHARMSLHFSSVLIWSMMGSLIFGFCSIWSLHEVAMLACEFDIPIGVDPPLTILSAVLATSFTFMALATDLLWDRYKSRGEQKHRKQWKGRRLFQRKVRNKARGQSSRPLLRFYESDDEDDGMPNESSAASMTSEGPPTEVFAGDHEELAAFVHSLPRRLSLSSISTSRPIDMQSLAEDEAGATENDTRNDKSLSQPSSPISSVNAFRFMEPAKSTFIETAGLLYTGCKVPRNIIKGFLWSLAITSMHYVGIFGLRVPGGYFVFNTWLVLVSALISWIVCTVGVIMMAQMETHLPRQILFSVVAAAGVAAMHFTGMTATTFYSSRDASDDRGYPPALANAVVAIAFVTCAVANVLVSHSATVSRNKLAEIVWTRKELWKTMALKENAEAAARARSEFIASASHEIRTPLHHLQGYSDLLAQTELTEEGRDLLTSIQRATKTLSLITNNVLDWSKFEQSSEGVYRPTAVDIRAVCESIIVLLPNMDEDSNVELFVVVSPDVPTTLFLDETWIHRILMNLMSNALKFTRSGYISLVIKMSSSSLVAVVTDTGCGLDPAFIPDMWMPFKQGEVRGSARGTGLGLTIIKQLLSRMNGKIEVESKYLHTEGVGPERSGTKFTVTLPVQSTLGSRPPSRNLEFAQIAPRKDSIAILSNGGGRAMEGLRNGWEEFGVDVTLASNVSELSHCTWKYIWADLGFLHDNMSQFQELLKNEKRSILVPYNTDDSLEGVPGILSAPGFVMIQKPLIWHLFEKRIAAANERARSATPSQALRFATEVKVLNGGAKEHRHEEAYKPDHLILLVEDNPINQKLGKKMLSSLGYRVLTANDGQEAIEQILKNDETIDLILMDQSMPHKDGITATKEIRDMEAEGTLSRMRPIIAVTAVVNSEAKERFEEAGADAFLAKPLALDKLKNTLAAHLP